MLIHGELETIVQFFEGFGLHINGDIPAMEFIYFEPSSLFGRNWNEEASRLGRSRRGSA